VRLESVWKRAWTGQVWKGVGEFGTLYSNSVALLADVIHNFGDALSAVRWESGHARPYERDGPVTNFKRSNKLYRENSGRDRDKDEIACEKE